MTEWKGVSERFTEVLGLKNRPVGALYTDKLPEGTKPKSAPACMTLLNARRGKTVAISRESSLCPGGAYYLGFTDAHAPTVLEFLSSVECIFSSRATSKLHLESCPPPARGIARRLLLAPLDSYPFGKSDPDLALFFLNPVQASRLFGLVAYFMGKPCNLTSFGATCRSAVGHPYSTGEPEISFIDVSAREMGRYPDDELIVSLPERYVRLAHEAIDRSICGAKKTVPVAKMLRGKK